ncbi:hypothetical protein KBC99_02330 [Candidatus Saccharibacteria bacterium]|nr:hypothetical protein [Candidatus Saccharibacteria bacterium]
MASSMVAIRLKYLPKPAYQARITIDSARWSLASLSLEDVLPQRKRGILAAREQICAQFKQAINQPDLASTQVRWGQLLFVDIERLDRRDEFAATGSPATPLQGVGQMQLEQTAPIQLALL